MSRVYPASERDIDPLYEAAQTLLAEAKSCTQDVWDGHRRIWAVCQSAKVIDELAITFAPYSQRPDQEVVSRPLLPHSHPNTSGSTGGATQPTARTPGTPGTPVPSSSHTPPPRERPASGSSSLSWAVVAPESGSDHGALDFTPHAPHTLSRESFERCSAPPQSTQPPEPTEPPPLWLYAPSRLEIAPAEYGVPSDRKEGRISPNGGFSFDSSINGDVAGHENPNILSISANGNYIISRFEDQGTNYTGSYWRSVDLSMPDSPSNFKFQPESRTLPSPASLDLPPPRILSKMIDVYYNNVWSTFPFLPTRPTIESLLSSVPIQSETFTTMLFALCAYCSHLSPTSEHSMGIGDASKVAADLWYERARLGVFSCTRRGSSVELVQALLLLALNDHGKGNETQAWIFVGMAVRIGQDMDLNGDLPTTYLKKNFPLEEIRLRRNIWSVSLMLDLFLSLQLGRPPASFDCLHSTSTDTHESEYTNHPVPIFLYAVSLCRIISRINLHLYLDYSTPNMHCQMEKLNALRDELETWYQFLPAQYRVGIGHQADRTVLELNMLHHVAIILLYRPL
ncbi:hypothetical protein AX15_000726 [Amanita polypyramis BW_CC]|nr:hypothetical protein AX15_000726 [Amanita polypyramis BW_CC]